MTAFWCELGVDVLRVSGADALTYLQGQISQDIRNLGDGESAYTFVLQPMGKVEALARIRRVSAEDFIIDTDAGFGESLAVRLNRFKIRVKVEIEPLEWKAIAVRGSLERTDEATPAWGRVDAFDIVGESPQPPAGLRHGSVGELLLARLEAGWPAMGHEISDASIPAETGVIAEAVSFTKGCYPGQELVERMDSRGSTAPRFVRRMRGEGSVSSGDDVIADDKVVGALTSVADTDEGWVALGIVARSVQPGQAVTVGDALSAVEETREN